MNKSLALQLKKGPFILNELILHDVELLSLEIVSYTIHGHTLYNGGYTVVY
jgi:hypothetical protein